MWRTLAVLLLVVSLLGWGQLNPVIANDESIAVIAHPKTPITLLSGAEVEALFTRTQTRWSDGSAVIPLNFPIGSALRDKFDRVVLRLGPEEVGRFWLDRRIRGLGMPPKQVPDANLMMKVVANLPGSIGYVPGSHILSGVKLVARLAQGKVVAP